jgi:predicted nucleotidyltransferase
MIKQDELLARIKQIVLSVEPTAKIYLYGSRARGEARRDSDWDLLILLNEEKITDALELKVTYPLYDLGIDLGEVISPMVYSAKEWATKHQITPYYEKVMSEGKLI